MNKTTPEFLDSVCSHILCRDVHGDVCDELARHIDELKEDYSSQGNTEEQSIEMAVAAMGDPAEIGKQLDKQHRPHMEWSLVGLAAVIVLFGGMIMFHSSHFYISPGTGIQAVDYEKFVLFAFAGIAVCAGLCFFDYTKLRKLAVPFYLIAFVLLVVALLQTTLHVGIWQPILIIWPFRITAGYAIPFFLVAFAGFMDTCRGGGRLALLKLGVLAVLPIIPVAIISVEMPQVLVLLVCYTTLLLFAVIKNHFRVNRKLAIVAVLIPLVCVVIVLAVTYLLLSGGSLSDGGYLRSTLGTLLAGSGWLGNQNANPAGIAVNGGGLFYDLPAATTDYVLANFIATFGWAYAIPLVLSIALFILRMALATRKLRNTYGFYLSLAACAALAVQYVLNILVTFGLLPGSMVTSLPFVSYGGMGYLVSMALLGIILSTWRRNTIIGSTEPVRIQKSASRFFKAEDGKLIISFK